MEEEYSPIPTIQICYWCDWEGKLETKVIGKNKTGKNFCQKHKAKAMEEIK